MEAEFKKGFENLEKQSENLAVMVKEGFDEVDRRFEEVDRRFEEVDKTIAAQTHELKSYIDEKLADYTSDIFKRMEKR